MAEPGIDDLLDALTERHRRRAARILRAGVSPNSRNERGSIPLYAAAGDLELTRLLLDAGADPNCESVREGEGLPLCANACWGATEVVRLLIASGADPNLCEDGGEGSTPLLWAITNGDAETVRALLDGGADPNLDFGGREELPLLKASEQGSLAIVEALLEHGAEPERSDRSGRTALEAAEAWVGKDVEEELRNRLGRLEREGYEFATSRTALPGGGERIEVLYGTQGNRIGMWRATGHAEIVAILRRASASSPSG